jgi:hypothetical protein
MSIGLRLLLLPEKPEPPVPATSRRSRRFFSSTRFRNCSSGQGTQKGSINATFAKLHNSLHRALPEGTGTWFHPGISSPNTCQTLCYAVVHYMPASLARKRFG